MRLQKCCLAAGANAALEWALLQAGICKSFVYMLQMSSTGCNVSEWGCDLSASMPRISRVLRWRLACSCRWFQGQSPTVYLEADCNGAVCHDGSADPAVPSSVDARLPPPDCSVGSTQEGCTMDTGLHGAIVFFFSELTSWWFSVMHAPIGKYIYALCKVSILLGYAMCDAASSLWIMLFVGQCLLVVHCAQQDISRQSSPSISRRNVQ